ncbi:MAG: PAS domain S-box protein, partial [Anaerolineae bacterium]
MSEQKALRKRLKQLFAELQEITASSPADEYPLQGWTWACDARGIYTACSPEVEEVLGIAAEEFIGQPLTSFRLAPESQRYLKAVLERAAPHSEAILQFIHKSGQLLSLRMHILKQQADDGQENGWSGFVQTIQEAATGDSAATLPPSPRLTRLSTDLP